MGVAGWRVSTTDLCPGWQKTLAPPLSTRPIGLIADMMTFGHRRREVWEIRNSFKKLLLQCKTKKNEQSGDKTRL